MENTEIRCLTIVNEKGLHARASAQLVETVEKYDAKATVFKDGMDACGDSIMGLLMLAASKGTQIEIRVKGHQAKELANALEDLIKSRFGESS
tara:strand:+ start:707 stop:985 length:279 start_codon:yes stop_codon:yes gene_type:complete